MNTNQTEASIFTEHKTKELTEGWQAYFAHLEHNNVFKYIKNKKVLELATANGLFWGTYAKCNPLSVVGLDPDDRWPLINGVKESDIIRESYETYLPKSGYDVIICFGLMYKLHSPIRLLELMASSKPEYILLEDIAPDNENSCSLYHCGDHGKVGDLVIKEEIYSRYVTSLTSDSIIAIMKDMTYTLEKFTEYSSDHLDSKKQTAQFIFKKK